MGGARPDEGPVSAGVVARAPVKVRTKLLVAFLAIAALLVRRERPRPAACSDSRMRGSSGSARCSSARRSIKRSQRPPPTCRRRSPCAQAGTATLTPYTGGKTLQGGQQLDARRPRGRRRALPDRSRNGYEKHFGSSRRPRTNASCGGSTPTTGRSLRASTGSSVLDGQGVAGTQGRAAVRAVARARPATTCDRGHELSPTRRAPRRRRSSATNRSAYTSSRDLFIARQRGERRCSRSRSGSFSRGR